VLPTMVVVTVPTLLWGRQQGGNEVGCINVADAHKHSHSRASSRTTAEDTGIGMCITLFDSNRDVAAA
jgi:hypothetical protein